MALVEVKNAAIGYPGLTVARGVSFEIAEGEFVAICGPNGAGKTTLLRSLVGTLPLHGGAIEFGFDPQTEPLGYVPQRDQLDSIFPLTALDVVLMGRSGRLGGLSNYGAADRDIARRALAAVNLEPVAGRSFFELSGGQRQRVLIARALCTEPRIVFLDEPTAGTDPGAEAAITELLRDLNSSRGLTIVVVSHHLRVVRALIPSTILVHDGVVEKGPTDKILELPRVEAVFGLVEANA